MRTGRPPIGRQNVTDWLQEYLASGPRRVSDIRKRSYASWKTTTRVKQAIGALSKKIGSEWFWYLPGHDNATKQNEVKATIPDIDNSLHDFMFGLDEEDDTIYTASMMTTARDMHLRKHEDERVIIRRLIADCRAHPSNPPYPESYIRAIVMHIVYGHPKPAIPDGISEPF